MSPPTSIEIQAAIIAQLVDELEGAQTTDSPPIVIEGLQGGTMLVWNATPPALDIFPAETYQEQERFGTANDVVYLNIRARVNTPDHDGAQEILLSLMDPRGAASLQAALMSDRTIGGKVTDALIIEGPSNYGGYSDPSGQAYLGCTWTVRVTL